MAMNRPLVLLSNDDGYAAKGLAAVRAALTPYADVIVCAPEQNQSATSHSLSLHRVLRLREVEPAVFALDGTPADCVYVALCAGTRVLPRRPDLVVSGLNHGLNLGVDVFYSGTVAAAREGALRGIPAIALSADAKADRTAAASVGVRLALAMLEIRRAQPGRCVPLLNVNVPPGPGSWPVRSTSLGSRLYTEEVIFRSDPRHHEYLWIGGEALEHDPIPGSDTAAYDEGAVSVTPLALNLNDVGDEAVAAARAACSRV